MSSPAAGPEGGIGPPVSLSYSMGTGDWPIQTCEPVCRSRPCTLPLAEPMYTVLFTTIGAVRRSPSPTNVQVWTKSLNCVDESVSSLSVITAVSVTAGASVEAIFRRNSPVTASKRFTVPQLRPKKIPFLTTDGKSQGWSHDPWASHKDSPATGQRLGALHPSVWMYVPSEDTAGEPHPVARADWSVQSIAPLVSSKAERPPSPVTNKMPP